MSYQFQGQRSQEVVLLLSRQHPAILLKPSLIATGILLAPFVLNIFFNFSTFTAIVLILSLVVGGGVMLLHWYSWINSIVLLTSERVVVLEQKGLMNRELSEAGLVNINQTTHRVKGFLETICGHGEVLVFTSGSQIPLILPNMPDPYDIQQEIQRAAAGEGIEEESEG